MSDCKACVITHTNLAHFFAKWAGVEHSGTLQDGTTIARSILADLRAVTGYTSPSMPPPSSLDTEPDNLKGMLPCPNL